MTRVAALGGGLVVLAVALLSGIDSWSERLLSVHMVQHLLIGLVAPALLVCAAPLRLALAVCSPRGRRRLALLLHSRLVRMLARPAIGVCLYAAVLLGSHVPLVYDAAVRHPLLHDLEHAAYFWSGVILLAPLIAVDPLPRAPSALARFAWLIAAMVPMAVLGAWLTSSTSVRYGPYLAPAAALHRSALADQRLAGIVMWVGGGVALLALALLVAARVLIAEERRQRRRDAHELAQPTARVNAPPSAATPSTSQAT